MRKQRKKSARIVKDTAKKAQELHGLKGKCMQSNAIRRRFR